MSWAEAKWIRDEVHGMIENGIFGGKVEFDGAGSYSFTVPANVKTIAITACGAGGGGGHKGTYTEGGGAGGGGGAAVKGMTFEVTPGQVLAITIGAGGAGAPTLSSSTKSQFGQDGGNTVIEGLLTLAGGKGGKATTTVGAAGGEGGGNGGQGGAISTGLAASGGDGVEGSGGAAGTTNNNTNMYFPGGGGGGSIGAGGQGGNYTGNAMSAGSNGTRGGGGGGGAGNTTNYTCAGGGAGGDGYVLIVWGTEQMSTGVVKSIQKGVAKNASNTSRTTITLSKVDPKKCMVLLDGFMSSTSNASVFNPVLKSLTATELVVDGAYSSSSGGYDVDSGEPVTSVSAFSFSWQVIEFY